MPTKKRRKNILGTMAEGDSVLLLPLFVSLVDIIKMPQTGQRKCLKLANCIAGVASACGRESATEAVLLGDGFLLQL
ncbi:MAG: hypothetical protein IKQ53_05630 [Bacteroidales bacterium]|nr:hypothetical protein [Bacteroidales bacterium]